MGCWRSADFPLGILVVRTDLPEARVVVLSEPFYPERGAFLDGTEVNVLRANIALSAAEVPAGSHTLELRFAPTSLYAGAATTALTAIGWLVAFHRSRRRACGRRPYVGFTACVEPPVSSTSS